MEEIGNYNIQWTSQKLENESFKGVIIVFGKGEVYVYYHKKDSHPTITEVVRKGKNVSCRF